MKNNTRKKQGLLIRLDDIAENMNWKLMDRCEKLFYELNIKPLLGVIPFNKDPELLKLEKRNYFWNKLKEWSDKGWEICMHGYTHVYDNNTNKKDYFNYGGRSEFYGHSLMEQSKRINNGLKIFNKNNLKIRSFFAPNHTYDQNTFKALKENGIGYVIDGYGIYPYEAKGLTFVPQLFYKEIMLPFGVQATQIHLNYWNEKKFENFAKFLLKNKERFLSFDQTLMRRKKSLLTKITNFSVEFGLKFIRCFK